ncbi:hypothetical protein HT594_00085 [Phenacoccus solenopsis nudivirus]|nr:hypothetical protein HT594_00085 [Phenacoccus solenopsis nudivirus]
MSEVYRQKLIMLSDILQSKKYNFTLNQILTTTMLCSLVLIFLLMSFSKILLMIVFCIIYIICAVLMVCAYYGKIARQQLAKEYEAKKRSRRATNVLNAERQRMYEWDNVETEFYTQKISKEDFDTATSTTTIRNTKKTNKNVDECNGIDEVDRESNTVPKTVNAESLKRIRQMLKNRM